MKVKKYQVFRIHNGEEVLEGTFVHFSDAYSFAEDCRESDYFCSEYLIKEVRV